jgi:uncharacterized phage-like protein YoqJ
MAENFILILLLEIVSLPNEKHYEKLKRKDFFVLYERSKETHPKYFDQKPKVKIQHTQLSQNETFNSFH